jgi:hypothetical protein
MSHLLPVEGEVTETEEDGAPVVELDRLNHVRVVSEDETGACVDRRASDLPLLLEHFVAAGDSPVN